MIYAGHVFTNENDVAVRFTGLDIPQVNLIVNWNLPLTEYLTVDCDTYLHRIGRSGRFGKDGLALSFIVAEELHMIKELEIHFGRSLNALSC